MVSHVRGSVPQMTTADEELILRCAIRALARQHVSFRVPTAVDFCGTPLTVRRYIVLASALLSLVGSCVIVFSALRFRELSKRFFAIRLLFFLSLADGLAALFNVMGVFVDVDALRQSTTAKLPFLCELQAVGLLYFNLASIMWTSCFAFTLYRDVVPSYRR